MLTLPHIINRGEGTGTTGNRGGGGSQSYSLSAVEDVDDEVSKYADDFEFEDEAKNTAQLSEDAVKEEEARLVRLAKESIQEVRKQQEEHVRQWQLDQERLERSLRERHEEIRAQVEELKRKQEETMREQEKADAGAVALGRMDVKEDISITPEVQQQQQQQQQQQHQPQLNTEAQRRRMRERARAVHLRRLEQEDAAHSLFQRLAQDVREVFHELNLSVVASEKERLLKDERYRKERELKDRREEIERQERLQKEAKEREEREAKFWSLLDERDARFCACLETRLVKDEEEREARLKRDLEDRETRLRTEKNLRDELERMERERRDREDKNVRDRDRVLIQTQLDDIKRQYEAQMEEIRRQFELDRAHAEEMHRIELQSIERRHMESMGQTDKVHKQHIELLGSHTGNADRLEKLIAQMHEDMEATKKMNVILTEERLAVLRQKELLFTEQKALVDGVFEELKYTKQEMEKERARIASLYAKFEISLSNFTKESAEERQRCQESQSRYETLRQQLEKDRKMMLHEIAQERKVFEQQYEEFMAKKLHAMSELQEERMAIARERTEAAMMRERQNTNETELLKSFRAQEEAFASKVAGIEEDRVAICEMRHEQKRLCDEIAAEREALRLERQVFETEKGDLLRRFEELQLRASETAAAHESLRREMDKQSSSRQNTLVNPLPISMPLNNDPMAVTSAATRLQIDLSRQRAILKSLTY